MGIEATSTSGRACFEYQRERPRKELPNVQCNRENLCPGMVADTLSIILFQFYMQDAVMVTSCPTFLLLVHARHAIFVGWLVTSIVICHVKPQQ
jgi:hypothetical protein